MVDTGSTGGEPGDVLHLDSNCRFESRFDRHWSFDDSRTLLGDYVEKGVNHGRKFFQKMQTPNKPGLLDWSCLFWNFGEQGAAVIFF